MLHVEQSSCADCGRPADPEARLCVSCYDSRISRGIRIDARMTVLDSNVRTLERERQAAAQRRYDRKRRNGKVQSGPTRRIVARHYLTSRELEELGRPDLRYRVLFRLECGHIVMRTRGRQPSARCGHCDQEEARND